MYLITVDYPETQHEIEVLRRTTTNYRGQPEQVMDGAAILRYQQVIREVLVREDLYEYALRLVQATRISTAHALPFAKEWVAWGAGPRACQYLLLGAKARAFFQGRPHITTADIQAVAKPVLRHRIIVNHAAISEGVTADVVVDQILQAVAAPRETVAK